MGTKQLVLCILGRLSDEASHDEIVFALRNDALRRGTTAEIVALARANLGPRQAEGILASPSAGVSLDDILKEFSRPSPAQ